MAITLKWNRPISQIVKDAVGGEQTALFAAETWHKLYYDFIPYVDGNLANQVTYKTKDLTGTIEHVEPYSHKQYNGDGFNFNTDKHPFASSGWDGTAKEAGKAKELQDAIQLKIKRGNK